LNVITFYADCHLPEFAKVKQGSFDWRQAIHWLEKSSSRQGYKVQTVTDEKTDLPAWLRVGDAKRDGLMRWILQAQAKAIREAKEPSVMVSPDSLVMGPLNDLFGGWDVVLLTRSKPKPIVNSVIAFNPSERLANLWDRLATYAERLDKSSLEWGADIDALVSYMAIQPLENGVRMVDDVRVRFMPMHTIFTSVERMTLSPPKTPIWDFKGSRKRLMAKYAGML
jgi:hypothetical protein